MPVNESYMAPGDFSVGLRVDTPHLMEVVTYSGHVVITPQHVGDPEGFTDESLLDAARYTGVVVEPEWRNGRMTVHGVGLDYHLGEGSIGPRLESGFSFSSATLQSALSGMLPATLTAGSIEASGSYSGSHQDQTCKEAVTALCRSLDAHYRINPDGTVDGELVGTGNVFVEDPTVVVVRENQGSDALWTGVPSFELISRVKGRDYADGLLVGSEGSNTKVTRSAGTQFYGINGEGVLRLGLDSGGGSSSVGDYGAGWLADHDVLTEESIRLDQYEIVPVSGGGIVKPGDVVFVWDPQSGFYDAANGPIQFRGEWLAPAKLRVAEVEWPLVHGMGVYYRPSASSVSPSDWVDLTRFVDWESNRREAQSMLRVLTGSS